MDPLWLPDALLGIPDAFLGIPLGGAAQDNAQQEPNAPHGWLPVRAAQTNQLFLAGGVLEGTMLYKKRFANGSTIHRLYPSPYVPIFVSPARVVGHNGFLVSFPTLSRCTLSP